MDNTNNVTHAADAMGEQTTLRPNIVIAADLWREIKKAAIDAGLTQSQWLTEAATQKLSHVKQQ